MSTALPSSSVARLNPSGVLVTAADEARLGLAYDAYRSGMPMEEISETMGFGLNELERLSRTPQWQEIQRDRADFRGRRLIDQNHDIAEKVMGTAGEINKRIHELAVENGRMVLEPMSGQPVRIPLGPADLKDCADALKSVAATAKQLSEAVGAVTEVTAQQNNFVNYLQIVSKPE